LCSQESHACLVFREAVDFPGGIRIKFESGEDNNCRPRTEGSRFFPGKLDLIPVKQAIFGTKGKDETLGLDAFGFNVRVQPTRPGQWFDTRKVNVVPTLPTKPSLEEFVAPLGMTQQQPSTTIVHWQNPTLSA